MTIYEEKTNATDITNPESVVNTIREYLDSDLSNEQKLYGIGVLLMKNKEHYITELRTKKERAEKEREALKVELQKLNVPAEPKKKVVIVKKAK